MIEYDFKDIHYCPKCFGDGYLNFIGYSTQELLNIARSIDSYVLAGPSPRIACDKCKGTGQYLNKLELEEN